MENIKETVISKLQADNKKWPDIAQATGISIHTLSKIGKRLIKNPGIDHMQTLYDFFRRNQPAEHKRTTVRRKGDKGRRDDPKLDIQ